jgi:hypothetical protein
MPKERECYVKQSTFEDVSRNQQMLIEILNHNFTEMKEDVKVMKNNSNTMAVAIAKLEASFSISSKILWTGVGIFVSLITAIIIGAVVS